jgi:hypothetical protein
MSEPDAPAARKAAQQTNSGLATAADTAPRHGLATRFGAALAAVASIVLLAGVAALLAWRAAPGNTLWGVAGVAASLLLGGLALGLLRWLVRDANRDAQALGAFAARLRGGDVAGAHGT